MRTNIVRAGWKLACLLAVAAIPVSAIEVGVKTTLQDPLPALAPYLFRSDVDGTVAVGGTIDPADSDETLAEIRVVKLNAELAPVWTALFAPPTVRAYPFDGALDPAGNVYVTGYTASGVGFHESVTLKYNSAGQPVWTNRFRPAGEQSQGRTLGTDAQGNVAVIYFTDSGAVLGKLNTNGTLGWTYSLGELAVLTPAPFYGGQSGATVTFDVNGNVLITRSTALNETNDRPVVLTVKLSAAGVPLWTNRYEKGFDRHSGVIPQAITSDRSGNVYVATFSARLLVNTPRRQRAAQRVTILSYSPNGRLRWVRHTTETDALAYLITPHALETDPEGGVYLTGARPLPPIRPGGSSQCRIHTVHYSNRGETAWRKRRVVGERSNYEIRFLRARPARVTLQLDEGLEPTTEGSPWQRTTVNYSRDSGN